MLRFFARVGAVVVVVACLPTIEADAELEDPIAIYFPATECATGMLEIEVWDRGRKAWLEHPDHPRILPNSCQVEEAGKLLNETRFKCVGSGSTIERPPWRQVQVYDPRWTDACPQPAPAAAADPFSIRVGVPARGRVVSNLDRRVEIEGWLELADHPVSGHDWILVLDAAPQARAFTHAVAGLVVEQLAARPESMRVAAVDFSSMSFSRLQAVPPRQRIGRAPPADAIRTWLQRPPDGPFPNITQVGPALEWAIDILSGEGSEPSEDLPRSASILLVVDGDATRPFGRASAFDPVYRESFEELARGATRAGIRLHSVVRSSRDRPAAELARRVQAESGGSLVWVGQQREAGEAVAALVAEILPPISEVMIFRPDLEEPIATGESLPHGRFRAEIAVSEGANPISVDAKLGTGGRVRGAFEVLFDSSAARGSWLEGERDRIERERERMGVKEVIVEIDE